MAAYNRWYYPFHEQKMSERGFLGDYGSVLGVAHRPSATVPQRDQTIDQPTRVCPGCLYTICDEGPCRICEARGYRAAKEARARE